MATLLWTLPALPLAVFVILALGDLVRLSPRSSGLLAAGSVGLSALAASVLAAWFLAAPPPEGAVREFLWHWMEAGSFRPAVAFRLDALSLVMAWTVAFVGFLIHVYSLGYMAGDEGYRRFFAYMNLFVGSMLVLVLADDLLVLYLGWEGVGLASYVLIGFWYWDETNVRAARKAFVVTRIGDAAMALGLFVLFRSLGTLDIGLLQERAPLRWTPGAPEAELGAFLLLAGAVGKSAQLPLQTWLPDAMAGPTPVSALIHAATMVTAGVYLVARTHTIFDLAPAAQTAVAVIGTLTLLLASASALVQRDVKRILAYSTMSQVGFMFAALGAGAWAAAVFHLVTHAFFKALLFLAAGIVILSRGHEQDIFKMGGLRKELPFSFVTFLIGASALAGLPFVTAGFYSKELILGQVWSSPRGGPVLWAASLLGAFLTPLYIFRAFFVVFFGAGKSPVQKRREAALWIPTVVLAVFSLGAGFVELPSPLGGPRLVSAALGRAFRPEGLAPPSRSRAPGSILLGISSAVPLLGVAAAWGFYRRRPGDGRRPGVEKIRRFWFAGWGFDRLYDVAFVRPTVFLVRLCRGDVFDGLSRAVSWAGRASHAVLARTQNGQVQWYAAVIVLGAAILLAVAVFR